MYGTEHHGAELKYQLTTLKGDSVARVFGTRNEIYYRGFAYFSYLGSNGTFWFLGNNKRNESVAPLDLDIHVGKWNVDGREEFIWDDVKKTLGGIPTTELVFSVPACIFRVYDVDVYRYSHARVYYCKIFDNGRIIRNFVPALDPTGRPCMYDLVGRKTYYNEATEGPDFLWGGDSEVELPAGYSRAYSVYFDGNTYVNTGITASSAPLYRADITAVVKDELSLIGAQGGGLSFAFIGLRANSNIYAGVGSNYGGSVRYSVKRCIWEFTSNEAYVDGVEIYKGSEIIVTSPWCIMGCPYRSSYNPMKGTFYGLTIKTAGGNLVAEYIPVYNSATQEFLLYDTVSKTPVSATAGQIKGSA